MLDPRIEVRLVLGVARLGEADLFGWWRSHGLGEAGQYVLGQSLPRTWFLTAFEGDILSAAARHEEVLGRRDALHLFSDQLPAKRLTLGWLRAQKVEGQVDSLLQELRGWSRERAIAKLREWTGAPPRAGEVLGQVCRLGAVTAEDLDDQERVQGVVRALAAAYADNSANLRFPYFDLQS